MTLMNQLAPDASPLVASTTVETRMPDTLIPERKAKRERNGTLSRYLTKIARLGGYLARSKDPPPGNMVMWRGLARLIDIELGYLVVTKLVGN